MIRRKMEDLGGEGWRDDKNVSRKHVGVFLNL